MTKPKKAKAAAQEVHGQVESQEPNGESIPPTIVAAAQSEVFSEIQTDSQEVVNELPAEKPAPKPKVSKRPYIPDVEILLSAGTHTKPQILAFIQEKYPTVSKTGASTFLTDLLNEKYRYWKDRAVVKLADGKLQFADRVPAATETPEPEAQPTGEPGETPAE